MQSFVENIARVGKGELCCVDHEKDLTKCEKVLGRSFIRIFTVNFGRHIGWSTDVGDQIFCGMATIDLLEAKISDLGFDILA